MDGAEELLAERVDFDAFERSKSDPRTGAVFHDWSRCMVERGYSYASPLAPAAGVDLNSTTISPLEIRTALADVTCKAATNVVGVWYAVESAYENTMIERVRPEFMAIQKHNATIVDNAVHVLEQVRR